MIESRLFVFIHIQAFNIKLQAWLQWPPMDIGYEWLRHAKCEFVKKLSVCFGGIEKSSWVILHDISSIPRSKESPKVLEQHDNDKTFILTLTILLGFNLPFIFQYS